MIASAVGRESPVGLHGRGFADVKPIEQRHVSASGEKEEREETAGIRTAAEGRALLTFFTKHHCADCRRAEAILGEIAEKQAGGVEVDVRKVYVDDPCGAEMSLIYLEQLGLGERIAAPALVSSVKALVRDEINEDMVEQLVLRAAGAPSPEAVFEGSGAAAGRRTLEQRFRELTVGAVIAGGLADGIFNPCAFTVIIFFIAYLTHMGKSRRQIFRAGITFMSAVFLTYMALSAGLLRVLMVGAAFSTWMSYTLMLVTGLLVLFVSVMSFRDAMAVRSGGAGMLRLGLPKGLKSYLRRRIRGRARQGLSVGGMLGLGAVVAAVELPCTGMMLIPIVVLLSWAAQAGGFGATPYGWLLVYNLAFILPLVFIFFSVYCGVRSARLSAFFRRHLFASKLVLGVVFLLLAVLLFVIPVMGQDRITDLVFAAS